METMENPLKIHIREVETIRAQRHFRHSRAIFVSDVGKFRGWIQDTMQTGMPNPQRVIYILPKMSETRYPI